MKFYNFPSKLEEYPLSKSFYDSIETDWYCNQSFLHRLDSKISLNKIQYIIDPVRAIPLWGNRILFKEHALIMRGRLARGNALKLIQGRPGYLTDEDGLQKGSGGGKVIARASVILHPHPYVSNDMIESTSSLRLILSRYESNRFVIGSIGLREIYSIYVVCGCLSRSNSALV
jgi:hypothetical protein